MSNDCVLCREPLSALPTNLEHYVHQVLIRNFEKLCVPDEFDWALRRDCRYDRPGQIHFYGKNKDILAPVSKHKEWATVEVHERCNSEMSYIGEAFKYIIDNIDANLPDKRFVDIFYYYANLWNVDKNELVVRILTANEAKSKYSNKKYDIVYEPFLLSCGRIEVECPNARRTAINGEEDKVQHTIMLGTLDALRLL